MSDRGITEPNKDDTEAQECLIQCDSVNYHFVVFGKSGTGKSSLCNQLANRDLQDVLKFRVGSGLSTVTVQCQQELAASPDGQLRFTVIDVPGESLDSHTKKFSLEKFVEKLQQHIRDNKELTPMLTGAAKLSSSSACGVTRVMPPRNSGRT